MIRIAFDLPDPMDEAIQELIEKEVFASRSEAIRAFIRRGLDNERE